jgi:hypothetical protein
MTLAVVLELRSCIAAASFVCTAREICITFGTRDVHRITVVKFRENRFREGRTLYGRSLKPYGILRVKNACCVILCAICCFVNPGTAPILLFMYVAQVRLMSVTGQDP